MAKTRLWHQPEEPIPAEVEARMTKPVVHHRYQVTVELQDRYMDRKRGDRIPLGPMLHDRNICEEVVSVINQGIAAGREKLWSSPQIVTTNF